MILHFQPTRIILEKEGDGAKVGVRAGAQLVRRCGGLWRVVEETESADGVVGEEVGKDIVAVGEAFGEDLHDPTADREDLFVVPFGGIFHDGVGDEGWRWEDVLPHHFRMVFGFLRGVGYVETDVVTLEEISHTPIGRSFKIMPVAYLL